MYLCNSQEHTFEQAQEMVCFRFCEAPRVVAANTDRDLQDTNWLLVTCLLHNTRAERAINSLASPPTVDI